jgi:dipicolinate synthase subunit A
MKNATFCIIGGDLRQVTVGKEFCSRGHKVILCGFDKFKGDDESIIFNSNPVAAITDSDFVILPLPYTKDKINIFAPLSNTLIPISDVKQLGKDKIFFGGMIEGDDWGRKAFDYNASEEFKIHNAIPTAEGALSIALNESTETIHGCNTAVLGFGRIGRILGEMLKKLGSDVTIVHRSNKDDAWCSALGLPSSHIRDIKRTLADKKIIFNTVPHILLDKEVLASLRRDVIIIDLASAPGGVDYDEGKRQGLNIIKALSLPGKLSPVTAGKAIRKSISNIIYDNNL